MFVEKSHENLKETKSLKKEEEKNKRKKWIMVLGPIVGILLGKAPSSIKETSRTFIPTEEPSIKQHGEARSQLISPERYIAEQFMRKDAENLYNGTCQNEKLRHLKGKLIMFKDIKGSINDELYDEAEEVNKSGEDLKGEARSKYMEKIIESVAESYEIGQSNGLNRKDLEELTAADLALIHEFNSIYRAGNVEDQIRAQLKAGIISPERAKEVKSALESSKESKVIANFPTNIDINGKNVEIGPDDELYQHIGKRLIEMPMETMEGAKIVNLYDLKKADPESYKKILVEHIEEYTDKSIGELKSMGAKVDFNDPINRARVREMLRESAQNKGKEISFNFPEIKEKAKNEFKLDSGKFNINGKEYKYRLGNVQTINIGENKINLPGIEVSSFLNGEKGIDVSFNLEAIGGRIDSKILCKGNYIRFIIPEHKTGLKESEEKQAFNALMLLILLPLVRIPSKRKNESPEKDGQTYENTPKTSTISWENPRARFRGISPEISQESRDKSDLERIRKTLFEPAKSAKYESSDLVVKPSRYKGKLTHPKLKDVNILKTPPLRYDESRKLKGMYKESPLVGVQHSREGEAAGGSTMKHRIKQGRSDKGGRMMGERGSRNRN